MRLLTSEEFQTAIAAKPAAVIHFDTDWDTGGRPIARRAMIEAERSLGQLAMFAEVDCDKEAQLAKSLPVSNVPLIAYYRNGTLVAALVGADQNILARAERMLRNEPIGYDDGTAPTVKRQ